jgi:hypothetical protein
MNLLQNTEWCSNEPNQENPSCLGVAKPALELGAQCRKWLIVQQHLTWHKLKE